MYTKQQILTQGKIDNILDQSPVPVPRHKLGEYFLKGPIPLAWLIISAKLKGKAMVVGIAIWHKVGLEKSGKVKITTHYLARFGINRKTAYRALQALAEAGLVKVDSHVGRSPIVTLLDAPVAPGNSGQVAIEPAKSNRGTTKKRADPTGGIHPVRTAQRRSFPLAPAGGGQTPSVAPGWGTMLPPARIVLSGAGETRSPPIPRTTNSPDIPCRGHGPRRKSIFKEIAL